MTERSGHSVLLAQSRLLQSQLTVTVVIPAEELPRYLCGEVATGLELLKEAGQGEGGEEENDGPEENIGGVGSMVSTRRPQKLPLEVQALLAQKA